MTNIVDTNQTDRLTRLGRAAVHTEASDAIIAMLRRAMRMSGTGHQGSTHILTGPTNTGKTTAIRLFLREIELETGGYREIGHVSPNAVRSPVASVEYVSVMVGDNLERPVIHIEIGQNPTFKSLLHDILYALLRTSPPRFANNPQLTNMLYNQLYRQRVKLLIFDDVQHIARSSIGRQAFEVFKLLAKVTNAEMVLCGLPEETKQIASADAQIVHLNLQKLEIGPLGFPVDDKAEFVEILAELEDFMPFDKRSPLSELELAQCLHRHSGGVLGSVKQTLRTASEYAMENGLNRVDRSVIAKALKDRRGFNTKGSNPFLTDADLESLR